MKINAARSVGPERNIIDEFGIRDLSLRAGLERCRAQECRQLSEHVNSYANKVTANTAAQRTKNVHATAENIEVRYALQKQTDDDQIAPSVLQTY
jgi:hypothetical protein